MSVFLRRDNTNIQDYLKVNKIIDSGLSDNTRFSVEAQMHSHFAHAHLGDEGI